VAVLVLQDLSEAIATNNPAGLFFRNYIVALLSLICLATLTISVFTPELFSGSVSGNKRTATLVFFVIIR
jgi:hypothetical protein